MENRTMITPAEVAQHLGVSKSLAYKMVRSLNDELKTQGYLTVAGKVSRAYFEEKFYGFKEGA